MKKQIERIFSVLLGMAAVFLLAVPVCAAETAPDLNRKGSISITITDPETEKAVPEGKLTVYCVAEAAENDGNYSFVYTEEFADCGFSLKDVQSEKLPKNLAQYAQKNGIEGTDLTISDRGKAVLSGLTPGLYLIVQTEAMDGYKKINPFLVSLPMEEKGTWNYEVDASPKVELKKKPEVPDWHHELRSDGSDTYEWSKTVYVLPQTGQLWWPVPLLTVLGMAAFALGWFQHRRVSGE